MEYTPAYTNDEHDVQNDLGLDPSDPLNLMFHNTPQPHDDQPQMALDDTAASTSGSENHGSPPDWEQLSLMWQSANDLSAKFPDVGMDGGGMDFDLSGVDFDQTMGMAAIDPHSLQYPAHVPAQPYQQQQHFTPQDLLAPTGFPFTFSSPEPSVSSSDRDPRSLSAGSSPSTSNASLSPVLDNSERVDSAVEELARRVCQAAGVTVAVNAGQHAQQAQAAANDAPPPPQNSKLPIPRLTPHPAPIPSKPASKAPTPTTTASPTPPPAAPPARTKTSHTTIERRYRTNLNARIQGLKAAVPALRALEAGADVQPDARGMVDGVKVARKGSKANVLGKAVEYIRVLKKREARLTREQAGLKALLASLVGGKALLADWERAWAAQFGGPERDELTPADLGLAAQDDDDSEEDGEDEDEERERARKKARVKREREREVKKERKPVTVPPPVSVAGQDGVVPEKRKRGRPRKNPLPPVPVSIPAYMPAAQPDQTQQQPQPQAQQYLLATFALFSLFNNPIASSPSSSPPTGHVVSPHPVVGEVEGRTWHDVIAALHVLVSVAVFCSVVVPWLPVPSKYAAGLVSAFTRTVAPPIRTATAAPATVDGSDSDAGSSDTAGSDHDHDHDRDRTPDADAEQTGLEAALAPARRGAPDEAARLRAALGVRGGVLALLSGGAARGAPYAVRVLEQRAWVRLGELVAVDRNASLPARIHAYYRMRAHLHPFRTAPADLVTLALLIYPLSRGKAESLWAEARRGAGRAGERLVLGAIGVGDAVKRLKDAQGQGGMGAYSPLHALAALLVHERVGAMARALFVRAVLGSADAGEVELGEAERREIVEAGSALGGAPRRLVAMLERVCAGADVGAESDLPEGAEAEDGEGVQVLRALALYRRLRAPDLTAATDKRAGEGDEAAARLHRLLGAGAFERSAALEDARDRVVDWVVEWERAERGR